MKIILRLGKLQELINSLQANNWEEIEVEIRDGVVGKTGFSGKAISLTRESYTVCFKNDTYKEPNTTKREVPRGVFLSRFGEEEEA